MSHFEEYGSECTKEMDVLKLNKSSGQQAMWEEIKESRKKT